MTSIPNLANRFCDKLAALQNIEVQKCVCMYIPNKAINMDYVDFLEAYFISFACCEETSKFDI